MKQSSAISWVVSINRISLWVLCLFFFETHAQEGTVFKSGEDGYASYRIPAIVKLKNGNLLAFAEGRVTGAGDYGNVDIVYKISKDLGKTWGRLQQAANYKDLQAGNAAPVEDLLDPRYPKGRLLLFYNTGTNHEGEVRKGNGYREAWYASSTDGGQTWSAPVNITTQVHRLNQPAVNPDYNFKENWRAYANTPGHAMQFGSGKYKGRIYIAANHSEGDPKKDFSDYFAHGYYSDDHGKTFKLAQSLNIAGSNESQATQVDKNELYFNSRNQKGNPKNRIAAYSTDGGETWDTTYIDKNLSDPVNQGSTLSWKKGLKYILAFSNTAHESKRDNLTLRISKDKGKTWYFNKVIARSENGDQDDFAAYSDLVLLSKNKIGILYEKDGYRTIVFDAVNIE